MSDYPGDPRPQGDEPDEHTRPLGWGREAPDSDWDAPGARPQSYDAPARPSEPAPAASPVGWGQPPYAGAPPAGWVPYGVPVADHPRANLAMVLGIVGLVTGLSCFVGFVLSPVAWVVGRGALREIRASGGHYGGEGQARAGHVLGIVGTVLLVLGLLAIVALVVFVVLLGGSGSPDYTNV